MADRVLVAALVLGLGIVAYRDVQAGNWPPRPSVMVGLAMVFTVLALLAIAAPGLAAAFAVAADLGFLLRPSGKTKSTTAPSNQPQTTGSTPVAV